MTPDEFFEGEPQGAQIYRAVRSAAAGAGPHTVRGSRSQVAFRRRGRTFAAVWLPRRYLGPRMAPLVLSILARHRITSKRWKEVVEPSPGRFTHHLELWRVADVDARVRAWLIQAWTEAG